MNRWNVQQVVEHRHATERRQYASDRTCRPLGEWNEREAEQEVDEAQQFRARSKCGEGKLEIKNVTLAEDKDTIRELSFRGEFSLPQ